MRIRAIALAATLVVALAGCGNDEPATPTAQIDNVKPASSEGPDLSGVTFTDETGQAEVEVVARDNVFIEEFIEVSPGTVVIFDNRGQQGHNVLPVDDGAFTPIEQDQFDPGESGTVTFEIPGDYSYYCKLHGSKTKGMTGTVRVLA